MTDPTPPTGAGADPAVRADPGATDDVVQDEPFVVEFWQRLKRHRVVQWTLAYMALAYTLLHGAEMLGSALGWPHDLLRVLALLLVLGAPMAAVLAWYHGARGAQHVTGAELLVLSGLLALGGTYIWRIQYSAEPRPQANATPAAAAKAWASVPPPAASIAVLAFEDMSPGHDQQYFSDGMAEEIQNALARIGGLKVAGRTSSFSFKGREVDLKTIGEALGVANILEGSVRKQGERLRISARLVRARDGFDVWSDTYDGTLGNVFDLQERIAREVAAKLQLVLQRDNVRLAPQATASSAAYMSFVEAQGLVNRRADLPRAIDLLTEATTLDPRFARAWSKLAVANAIAPQYSTVTWQTGWVAGEAAARRALALDSSNAEAYAVLGYIYLSQRRYAEMVPAFERALQLNPSDPIALFWAANALESMGRNKAAGALVDRVLANDPVNPMALMYKGVILLNESALQPAMDHLQRGGALGARVGGNVLSAIVAERGDLASAAAYFVTGWGTIHSSFSSDDLRLIFAGAYGNAGARKAALAVVDAHAQDVLAPSMYLYVREPGRAFAAFERYRSGLSDAFLLFLWQPPDWSRLARQHPAFQGFAQRLGIVAYWKHNGWPDLCRAAPERGPDAFICR